MKRRMRLTPALLAGVMALGTVPAYAMDGYDGVAEAGNVGNSQVTLSVEDTGTNIPDPNPPLDPAIFSAYVPSELPIKMDLQGNVVTPNNAMIINGVTTRGICVKNIDVDLAEGWTAAAWGDDFVAKADDTKDIGLKLRSDMLLASGEFTLDDNDWKIAKGSYVDLNMDAKIPKQTEAGNKGRVATISFTLDWSGDDVTEGSAAPTNPGKPDTPKLPTETAFSVDWENGLMVPGTTNVATFKWATPDDNVTLKEVVSDKPAVAFIDEAATAADVEGQKSVMIKGRTRGTATVTGKLSNGKEISFTVEVSTLDNNRKVNTHIPQEKLVLGEKLTADGVTVDVPILRPDGEEAMVTLPVKNIEGETLVEGANALKITVDVGGQELTVNLTLTLS